MTDKPIGELNPAKEVAALDNLVLEQAGEAKRITGQTFLNQMAKLLDGHGGFANLKQISTVGLNNTYAFVWADGTETRFTVTNGAKGDPGPATYIHVKYSAKNPVSNSDMGDIPDAWMGIYVGPKKTAPSAFAEYKWQKVEGEKGKPGNDSKVISSKTEFQASDSGTTIPSGNWLSEPPEVAQGRFLWTRTTISFNNGSASTVSYGVSYIGRDGSGTVKTVSNIQPDDNGNIDLTGKIKNTDLAKGSVHGDKLLAAGAELGGVRADRATAEMTELVGIGEDGKLKTKPNLVEIWENASPDSEFSAQEIKISALSGFIGELLIVTKDQNLNLHFEGKYVAQNMNYTGTTGSNAIYFYTRECIINAESLNFGNCKFYVGTTYNSLSNENLVPLAIYKVVK